MKRRSFLGALAGLIAAPSLIERVRAEARYRGVISHIDTKRGEITVTTTSDFDRLMKEVYSQPLLLDEGEFYGISEMERHAMLNGNWDDHDIHLAAHRTFERNARLGGIRP